MNRNEEFCSSSFYFTLNFYETFSNDLRKISRHLNPNARENNKIFEVKSFVVFIEQKKNHENPSYNYLCLLQNFNCWPKGINNIAIEMSWAGKQSKPGEALAISKICLTVLVMQRKQEILNNHLESLKCSKK